MAKTALKKSETTLHVTGTTVEALSPEGQKANMSLSELMAKADRKQVRTGILPDGVKAILSQGDFEIWIHQTPPRLHSFKWIAKRSRQKGVGARYRQVQIALPYVIVFAVFGHGDELSNYNECFFATSPLSDLKNKPCYPALLNCSSFKPEAQEGRPLSWICVQHLSPDSVLDTSPKRAGLKALLRTLFETGFNNSSEIHEGSSWFNETVKASLDPRISSVDAWQKASAQNPLFILDILWLPCGHTIGEIAERTFNNVNAVSPEIVSASDLARIVFNQSVAVSGFLNSFDGSF